MLNTENGISGNVVPDSMPVESFFTDHLRVLIQGHLPPRMVCANPLKRKPELFTTEQFWLSFERISTHHSRRQMALNQDMKMIGKE